MNDRESEFGFGEWRSAKKSVKCERVVSFKFAVSASSRWGKVLIFGQVCQ